MSKRSVILIIFLFVVLTGCNNVQGNDLKSSFDSDTRKNIENIIDQYQKENKDKNSNNKIDYSNKKLKKIYLAGGCFWGLEAYMERIYGVANAISGYANGKTTNPTYEEVSHNNTNHAETVEVLYSPELISLEKIIEYYLKVIDPTSKNKQGNDQGSQYRSGIYFTDPKEKTTIEDILKREQNKYIKKIVIEVESLKNFYKAEEYHQDY